MSLSLNRPPKGECKGLAALCTPPRAAAGGAQKKQKELFGGPYTLSPRQRSPNPGRRLRPLHSRFVELLLQKFGMTHVINKNWSK